MAEIMFFFGVIVFLWILFTLSSPQPISQINLYEAFLTEMYHKKPSYKQRLVLIIEFDRGIGQLVTLIRNILRQSIKADSIVVISQNNELNKVQLIHNTCLIQKVGGKAFLFKESGRETTIVHIFRDGFNAFVDPQFLKHFLDSNTKINGLVKVENDSVKIGIDSVYK